MTTKTIFWVLLAVLITVIFMQNTDETDFKILFLTYKLGKSFVLIAVLAIGLLGGYWLGRRNRVKKPSIETIPHHVDFEITNSDEDYVMQQQPKNGLSVEDEDYIS